MTEALTWLHSNPGKWAATAITMIVIGVAALLLEYWKEHRGK